MVKGFHSLSFFKAALWEIILVTGCTWSCAQSESQCRPGCNGVLRPFNPILHKSRYLIGVQDSRGDEEGYRMAFGEFLTATAGRRFDPPVEFETILLSKSKIYDYVESGELDFVYANPGVYTCIGMEHGAEPLATTVRHHHARGHDMDLDLSSGVIFASAVRDDIVTIEDLRDKIIAVAGMTDPVQGQAQFHEMERHGLSPAMDPKQIVVTNNQDEIVRGVVRGDFDVGFIRTSVIETSLDENGGKIDPDLFKIINPQVHLLEDGTLFPFFHSTQVFPEWPFLSTVDVPNDVGEEVQSALIQMRGYATNIEEDVQNVTCVIPEDMKDLADVALETAHLHGFRSTMSYFGLSTMYDNTGFFERDGKGGISCKKPTTLYESIECPEGHYKLQPEEYEKTCEQMNLPCKEGYE
eukprot:scaffold1336_cov174-Amphora_coffeaeformis.AAC.8